MKILGLNCYHWDSSVCVVENGKLLYAIEEERLNRVKHWSGFPILGINSSMSKVGWSYEDLDIIAVANRRRLSFDKIKYAALNPVIAFKSSRGRKHDVIRELALYFNVSYNKVKKKVVYVDHHVAHVASAYYCSGYENSAFLTLDAMGDFKSSISGVIKNNKWTFFKEDKYPNSLGILYTAITQYLGFTNVGDEYKVMGLAPYGKPKYVSFLRELLQVGKDGRIKMKLKYFTHNRVELDMRMDGDKCILPLLYSKVLKDYLDSLYATETHANSENGWELFQKDLASSLQSLTEDLILSKVKDIKRQSGSITSICIAGGVGQNSVANGKLHSDDGFNKVFIPWASHDAGLSIGAALYESNKSLGYGEYIINKSPYLGDSFTEEEIIRVLKESNLSFENLSFDLLLKKTVDLLTSEHVIGWFQGASEFGPRALGNRSIIVDPRNPNVRDLLNLKIKRRENFRPFAPSILEEFVDVYFENGHSTPYMERVLNIRNEYRPLIPAVTHVDGTGRLQTVSEKSNQVYYNLIKEFYKATNVPVLLNTSFNENEPIVNSPQEAISVLMRTDMDALVINNFLITKNSR